MEQETINMRQVTLNWLRQQGCNPQPYDSVEGCFSFRFQGLVAYAYNLLDGTESIGIYIPQFYSARLSDLDTFAAIRRLVVDKNERNSILIFSYQEVQDQDVVYVNGKFNIDIIHDQKVFEETLSIFLSGSVRLVIQFQEEMRKATNA